MKRTKKEWHNIRRIEPNGEIKWVASYDGKFCAERRKKELNSLAMKYGRDLNERLSTD